jgi:hypothetical protein
MTTINRSSTDISLWVAVMLAIVLVVAMLSGVFNGVEVSAPSIGFDLPGFPEATPDPVPAHIQEMQVFNETGAAVIELPPVHLIEEQIAGA